MTELTFGGIADAPTNNGSEDTWGLEIRAGWDKIHTDLNMLNTTTGLSFLGKNTAGDGEVMRLTVAQSTAMLNAVVGDSGAGGIKGLVPAPASGDTAAGKVLTAAGTWGSEIKARGTFTGSTGVRVAGRNVTLSRTATGQYTATLSPSLANANYEVQVSCQASGGTPTFAFVVNADKTTSGFKVTAVNFSGGVLSPIDPSQLYLTVLG